MSDNRLSVRLHNADECAQFTDYFETRLSGSTAPELTTEPAEQDNALVLIGSRDAIASAVASIRFYDGMSSADYDKAQAQIARMN